MFRKSGGSCIHASLDSQIKAGNLNVIKLCVKIDHVREMYQNAIGSHPDQSDSTLFFQPRLAHADILETVPRGMLPDSVLSHTSLRDAWRALGLTAFTYSWGKFEIL